MSGLGISNVASCKGCKGRRGRASTSSYRIRLSMNRIIILVIENFEGRGQIYKVQIKGMIDARHNGLRSSKYLVLYQFNISKLSLSPLSATQSMHRLGVTEKDSARDLAWGCALVAHHQKTKAYVFNITLVKPN